MQVLFFSSIFANLFGRLLPKFKTLSVRSPLFLLALAVAQAAVSPIAFVYFKSGPSWHSDLAAIGEQASLFAFAQTHLRIWACTAPWACLHFCPQLCLRKAWSTLEFLAQGCICSCPDKAFHSPTAGYVVVVWAAGGYINTNAYVVAPQCVPSNLKASAAGLMAMTSQLSHTAGLLVAVVLAEVLFGGIAVV